MKHVTVGDENLLVGDEAADLLMEYAMLLGQEGSADAMAEDYLRSRIVQLNEERTVSAEDVAGASVFNRADPV